MSRDDGFMELSEDALSALSTEHTLRALLALFDEPVTVTDVARELEVTEEEARATLTELVVVGLVEVVRPGGPAAGTRFRARFDVVSDERTPPMARLAFRNGLLKAAARVVEDGRRALRRRPEDARVGVALVTLPDDPAVFQRAIVILADAERQLKALRDEAGLADAEHTLRVSLLIASE